MAGEEIYNITNMIPNISETYSLNNGIYAMKPEKMKEWDATYDKVWNSILDITKYKMNSEVQCKDIYDVIALDGQYPEKRILSSIIANPLINNFLRSPQSSYQLEVVETRHKNKLDESAQCFIPDYRGDKKGIILALTNPCQVEDVRVESSSTFKQFAKEMQKAVNVRDTREKNISTRINLKPYKNIRCGAVKYISDPNHTVYIKNYPTDLDVITNQATHPSSLIENLKNAMHSKSSEVVVTTVSVMHEATLGHEISVAFECKNGKITAIRGLNSNGAEEIQSFISYVKPICTLCSKEGMLSPEFEQSYQNLNKSVISIDKGNGYKINGEDYKALKANFCSIASHKCNWQRMPTDIMCTRHAHLLSLAQVLAYNANGGSLEINSNGTLSGNSEKVFNETIEKVTSGNKDELNARSLLCAAFVTDIAFLEPYRNTARVKVAPEEIAQAQSREVHDSIAKFIDQYHGLKVNPSHININIIMENGEEKLAFRIKKESGISKEQQDKIRLQLRNICNSIPKTGLPSAQNFALTAKGLKDKLDEVTIANITKDFDINQDKNYSVNKIYLQNIQSQEQADSKSVNAYPIKKILHNVEDLYNEIAKQKRLYENLAKDSIKEEKITNQKLNVSKNKNLSENTYTNKEKTKRGNKNLFSTLAGKNSKIKSPRML